MRNNYRAAAGICLAALLVVGGLGIGCSKDSSDNGGTNPTIRHPQDFLPTSVSGWTMTGEIASGTTDAELQAEINGGYQTYTRHNMKEFAMADYLGTSGGSAGIHIYECDTTPDAQELYNDPDFLPHGSQSPAVGDLADMGSASGATTLRFARNQYYTEIVLVSADTQYAEQQAELLAAGIDSQMQED